MAEISGAWSGVHGQIASLETSWHAPLTPATVRTIDLRAVTVNRDPSEDHSIDRAEAAAARVPAVITFGAAVVLVQCLAIFGYSIWLIATNLRGTAGSTLESASAAADFVGIGTAVFLLIVFGFVAFHAVRTLTGRPSGRGAIVLIEGILLGVAVYMFSGGAIVLGVVTAVSAILALVGAFHPAAVDYWAARWELRSRKW